MAAEVLKYQTRQSSVSLSNNCCVLQTNREAMNKKFKISLKSGAIPKMSNDLLEVYLNADESEKGKNKSQQKGKTSN